jgi:hypothetical protein
LVAVQTSMLACDELAHVSEELGAIGRDAHAAQRALALCSKVWEELVLCLKKHFAPLPAPEQDLFDLLTLGPRSVATLTYLQTSCAAPALAKLSRHAAALLASAARLLERHLQRSAEALVVRAANLRGHASGWAGPAYAALGLDAAALVEPLLHACEALLAKTLAAGAKVRAARPDLALLLEWVGGCALRAAGGEAAEAAPGPELGARGRVLGAHRLLLIEVAAELGLAAEELDAAAHTAPAWDRAARQKKQRMPPAEAGGGLALAVAGVLELWRAALPCVANRVSASFRVADKGRGFACADHGGRRVALGGWPAEQEQEAGFCAAFCRGRLVVVLTRGQGPDWREAAWALAQGDECADVKFCTAEPGKPMALAAQVPPALLALTLRRAGQLFLCLAALPPAGPPSALQLLSQLPVRGPGSGLAVSGPRGVAAVLSLQSRRVELLDLVGSVGDADMAVELAGLQG